MPRRLARLALLLAAPALAEPHVDLPLAQAAPGTPDGGPRWAPPIHLDTLDAIPYRLLGRDDFRGGHPPREFLAAVSGVRPVAVSCAYLIVEPSSRMVAVPVAASSPQRYRARIESLSFGARLSRRCSWWNLESSISPAYVLEHEQLHFDIFEVAARRLNRDAPAIAARLEVEAPTAGEALEATRAHVQEALAAALSQVSRRNAQLDRDTSFGLRPERQATWRRTLDGDLEELSAFAGPAP